MTTPKQLLDSIRQDKRDIEARLLEQTQAALDDLHAGTGLVPLSVEIAMMDASRLHDEGIPYRVAEVHIRVQPL